MAGKSRKRISSQSNIMFTNAVYFPSHAVYQGYTPAQLNYSCVSLVYYAFATVTPEGYVFLGDEWADVGMPCDGVKGAIGSLLHLKQKHRHLQVVLSIGGGRSDLVFAEVASDPVRRDVFAQSAYGLLEASGLDGIDINWLYPSDVQQTTDFLALLAQTRRHLPEDRYYLTATLPTGKEALKRFNVRNVAEHVDLLNVAAYDLSGPWSTVCGHHAQLYAVGRDDASGASAIQYLMAHGVPAKKILLGVPLFGRSFLGTVGPGHTFAGVGGASSDGPGDGTFAYNELPRPGTTEVVDKRVVGAQCVGGDGGFVTYDNPETVKAKAQFCKQKALGGLYYWSAPFDTKDLQRSLVAAGFRALHS